MIIQLRHTKSNKLNSARPKQHFFRATTNPRNFPYCPIFILLAHALRHGIVYGTSVEEVLQNTILHGKRLR